MLPNLDSVCALFGITDVVKTEKSPPFNVSEFKEFANHFGFKRCKMTSLWSKSNEEAETFMKTVGKSIRAAHIKDRSWKQELYDFVSNSILVIVF